MKTVTLGTDGCSVSALCLGTMYFGTTVEDSVSFQILDAYAEAGGTFLDTANKYASWVAGGQGGESELLLGRWIKERRNRERLFLASKVGLPMPGVPKGLKAVVIEQECEKTLRRLGVDRLDLYYAHADDREAPLEETLGAFDRLQRAGKVRYFGASNFETQRLDEARRLSARQSWPAYVCVQMRHTYLHCNPRVPLEFTAQMAVTPELLDYCKAENVRLLAYSPLLGGAYCRGDRPLPEAYRGPENERRLKRLSEMARACGATVNQVVLAWLMQSQPAAIPVVSASSPGQIRENLGALSITIKLNMESSSYDDQS